MNRLPPRQQPAPLQRSGASPVTRQRLIDDLRAAGVNDERVLAAMAKVPRHEFVEPAFQSQAYKADLTLPIGHAQTLSQARIVAVMTQAALPPSGKPQRVLEIGTGSGYQTAVMAEVSGTVFSVERIQALSETARRRLTAMGYRNVHFGYADGTDGWAAFAPYDAILVTAGADALSPTLKNQLAPGGRLVVPVGSGGAQTLLLITRTAKGFDEQKLAAVSFVPLLPGRS